MAIPKSRFNLALAMLLIGASRFYAWELWPPELRGPASKMLGSMAALCLIGIVYSLKPSRLLAFVCAWYAFEELQTVICSMAYMVEPWAVPVGMSICSARIDFDIGAVGIMFVAFLLWRACVRLPRPRCPPFNMWMSVRAIA